MDFTSDTLADSRAFRTLNLVDDSSRECVAIEVVRSIPGERVTRVLDRLAVERGLPRTIEEFARRARPDREHKNRRTDTLSWPVQKGTSGAPTGVTPRTYAFAEGTSQREMSKNELEAYASWFHTLLPQRIAELAAAVSQSPGFEGWRADETPQSLERLSDWFEAQVETRPLTESEKNTIRQRLLFPIDLPEESLTHKTLSLAMDVGMYFAQVVLKNLRGTS
jgi:hypothetical protein